MLKYFFLLLLFSVSNLKAQNHSKDIILCTNLDGVDTYPAYQVNVKKSFIDSIIYAGPFIIFCVSFQKPNSDKKYSLESPKSNKSWSCHNYQATRNPIKILNVKCNNELISENLSEKPLDIIFEKYSSSLSNFSKISCEFLFWRADFASGDAILSESFKAQRTTEEAKDIVEFKKIKIRKKHFTKPLNKYLIERYINNHTWEKNQLFENLIVRLNDKIIDNSTFTISSKKIKYYQTPLKYFVDKKTHNQIYLDMITQSDNQTIFSIRYYSQSKSKITLYNAKPNKFYFQYKSKKSKMKTIRNICLNGKLITEELEDGNVLKFDKIQSATILTFDVHFDTLPERLVSFDLIEGKRLKGTTPFDIFNIQH